MSTVKVLISKDGRAWKKNALALAQLQRGRAVTITGDVVVTMAVHFRDRRRDLDNVAKPILDLLQAAELIGNDRQVSRLVLTRHIDRGDPRVEVQITRAQTEAAA